MAGGSRLESSSKDCSFSVTLRVSGSVSAPLTLEAASAPHGPGAWRGRTRRLQGTLPALSFPGHRRLQAVAPVGLSLPWGKGEKSRGVMSPMSFLGGDCDRM